LSFVVSAENENGPSRAAAEGNKARALLAQPGKFLGHFGLESSGAIFLTRRFLVKAFFRHPFLIGSTWLNLWQGIGLHT